MSPYPYLYEFEEMNLFYTFWNTIGYVVCKDGLLLGQDNILSILDMVAPTSVCELCATLVYTGYYQWFIQNYVKISSPLEKLIYKDTEYVYT
jgi:hypothetical protein